MYRSGQLLIVMLCLFFAPALMTACAPAEEEIAAPIRFTVVYNNIPHDERLETSWGFACYIEGMEENILFDTGGDGRILLVNMKSMAIEPGAIDCVLLSHYHGDHTNGLEAIREQNPGAAVYMPESFPDEFRQKVANMTGECLPVSGPVEVMRGAFSTGEMGDSIIEESLALDTPHGLIVITGCAHPGIVDIVKRSKELVPKEIHLVMGGFHLGRLPREEVLAIIEEFRAMGVKKVAPTHCTGDMAIRLFREAYGEDFIEAGCGAVIEI